MPDQLASSPVKPQKIFYIDHLRVLLTILVALHHTCVTYGAPGGWYYSEKTIQLGAVIPMTMFVAINQSFFMGFFFFLSAYFIQPSYNRKGSARFIADRLLRLGVPLISYSFIFSPFLSYLVYFIAKGHHITYMQYLGGFDNWIDFGVLWFVAALLLFTLLYALWRFANKSNVPKEIPVPTAPAIIAFAIIVGLISFLVRVAFPVGWVLKPLGFQLGHFTQYIVLFIAGTVAFKNNWLNALPYRTGKQMAWLTLVLILLFPAFYVIKVKLNMPIEWYSSGFHWQSALYAVWEQVIGFAIITALLALGKKFWDRPSRLLNKLSRYTFAVYIFHPLAIISLSLAVRNWSVDPSLKLLLVAPLAVMSSFLLASIIVMIPGVKKVI